MIFSKIKKRLPRQAGRSPWIFGQRYYTKLLYAENDKIMFKKLYAGNKRLLILVAERAKDQLKIITIIDTSKPEKYL